MKIKLLFPLLLFCGLLLAGCGAGETAVSPAEEPTMPLTTDAPAQEAPALELQIEGTPLLIFQRTGGFAGLEDEWWLFGDGRIVNQRDNQVQQVDGNEVMALHQDMLNGDFMNLSAEYMPATIDENRFVYTVTLIDGENRHTVTTMDEAENAPDLLRESLRRITTLLVSQRE